ncbi:DUF563 domain-containing protein [Pontibacillus salicampi]|uniref:DUF563 domain-containing protein n=1 Tax=Pontibacillus salicampi TaxID=1449801 RepID=A0ABV6LQ48_9BACI
MIILSNIETHVPTEFYQRTFDWAKAYFKDIDDYYKVIYPKESITFSAPKGLDPIRWPVTTPYQEAFVCIIPEGRIFSSHGYVATPDNKRMRDIEFTIPLPYSELPVPDETEETVAHLLWGGNDVTQNNYHHFLLDILPRYHLLQRSNIHIDKYVFGKMSKPFHKEWLNMLGIPKSKVIEIDPSSKFPFHLKAKKVIVPSVPRLMGGIPKWAVQYIKDTATQKVTLKPDSTYKRIYISREDAGARYIVNESELKQLLVNKGFKTITLSSLSVKEQVEIFSSADVVLAPVGAGNTNLIFSKPGAKHFELSPRTMNSNVFWKICNHLNLEYFQIVCPIEEPPKVIGGIDNLIVDIDKLNSLLQMEGI